MNPHTSTHKPTYRGPLEPSVEFDFESVESPAAQAREELAALGLNMSEADVSKLLHWIIKSHRIPNIAQHTIAERILHWIGSANETGRVMRPGEDSVDRRMRRIGTRALVAISECTPHATSARLSMQSIAVASGVTKNTIQGIVKEFRQTMGEV